MAIAYPYTTEVIRGYYPLAARAVTKALHLNGGSQHACE